MASEIIVNTIKAPTTGANANKVIIPSGVTLDASGGTILPSAGQIVQEKLSDVGGNTVFNGSSYADAAGFSITITPKYSDSKFVISMWAKTAVNNASSNSAHDFRILRDSTTVYSSRWTNYLNRNSYAADSYPIFMINMVDEPNTTSAITYKLQGRLYNGDSSQWSFDANGGSTKYFMSVKEIKQ